MDVNAIIDKSAILLPPNANFIEYFAKRVPVYCRIEPKDDIKDLPLINVGDVQIENLLSQADLSVITEYSGVSMLWLKKTAQNRHEANEMFLATILFVVVSVIIVAIINIYVLILASKVLWGFAKDKIFTNQQSKRIGRIVFLLILSDIVTNISVLGMHYYAASKLTFANWEFVMPNLYISGIITAIILWLFNEILKQTILLKEEQSLTI